jgi:hypothetical protein
MNEYTVYDDKRVQSGYSAMLLVKEPSETLYSIIVPLESVPSVFGSPEAFDFNFLSAPTKGKIEGKEELETKDVEVMWHRDNILRLEALQNKVLDFLVVYQDYSGRAFSGTLRSRPNDAGAEVLKGTMTITPLSATTASLLDCRDLIKSTVYFASIVPAKLTIATTTASTVNLTTVPFLAVVSATVDNSNFVLTVTQPTGTTAGNVAIAVTTVAPGTTPQYGIVTITASLTGYAEWNTTVAVNY